MLYTSEAKRVDVVGKSGAKRHVHFTENIQQTERTVSWFWSDQSLSLNVEPHRTKIRKSEHKPRESWTSPHYQHKIGADSGRRADRSMTALPLQV